MGTVPLPITPGHILNVLESSKFAGLPSFPPKDLPYGAPEFPVPPKNGLYPPHIHGTK